MAVNSNPLFTGTPKTQAVLITAANTLSSGAGTIGTDIFLAFESDDTDGGFVEQLIVSPWATVASTATTATALRVFITTQSSGATTTANTFLIRDIGVASQTADAPTAGTTPIVVPLNIALGPGQNILVTMHHTPAANTGWTAVVIGGTYTAL